MSSVGSSDCGNELILQDKFNKLKSMYIRDRKLLAEARKNEEILKRNCDELSMEIDLMNNKIKSFETTASNVENEPLLNSIHKIASMISVSTDSDLLLERISALLETEAQSKNLTEEVNTLISRLSFYENQHNNLNIANENALNSASAEITSLTKKVNYLETQVSSFQSPEIDLLELIKKNEELHEVVSVHEQALLSRTNEIQQLDKKIEFQKKDYDKLIREKETEINELREALDRKSSDYDDDHELLVKQNKNLKDSVDSTILVLNLMNSQLQKSTHKIEDINLKDLLPQDSGLTMELESLMTLLKSFLDSEFDYKTSESKANMLDLELNEYAISLSNLKDLLKKKEEEIKDLNIEMKEAKNNSEQLLNTIDGLNDKNVKMKNLLLRMKKEYSEKEKAFENSKKSEQEVSLRVKELENKLKNVETKQSTDTSMVDHLKSTIDALHEELISKSRQADRSIDSLSRNRELLKSELDSLKEEFSNYKIKAESTLSLQMENSTTFEQMKKDLDEETRKCCELTDKYKDLEKKFNEIKLEYSLMQNQRDLLQQETDRLGKELQSEIMSKDQNLIKIKQLETELKTAQAKILSEKAASDCLETQSQSLRRKLEAELHKDIETHLQLDFQLRLTQIENENRIKMDTLIHDYEAQITQLKNNNESKPINDELFKIDMSAIKRPDTEGSEIVTYDGSDCSPTQKMKESCNISKRKILASKIAPLNELFERKISDSKEDHSKHDLSRLARLGIDEIFDLLTIELKKNEHLTSLLSDSESLVNFLTEQSKLLKSEIRRLERDLERSIHLGDLNTEELTPLEVLTEQDVKKTRGEYLKNILIKFLTLPRNFIEERRSLVPVITTMLSLNPQERQMLVEFASSGCAPLDSSNAQGWSSYLSLSTYWPTKS